MAHADRLFAPFVRLHDANDFERHGIGLMSAKRIVERHGGQIWAEARVGQGATDPLHPRRRARPSLAPGGPRSAKGVRSGRPRPPIGR